MEELFFTFKTLWKLMQSLNKKWKLQIWSHLLKKSLIENFIFCAVNVIWSWTYLIHFWSMFHSFLSHHSCSIQNIQLICNTIQKRDTILFSANEEQSKAKSLSDKTPYFWICHHVFQCFFDLLLNLRFFKFQIYVLFVV